MKNINFIVASLTLAFAISLSAHAAEKKAVPAKKSTQYTREYGMAGCGLGSMAIGKKGGQIFAATTNGTSYNQTFGITSGTSNCVDGPNSEVAMKMDHFIATNKLAVASDIARGNGETLVNLSGMMGCAEQSAKLSKLLQSKFGEIFPTSNVYPNEITDSIITNVLKNDELSASCKKLG